MKSVTEFSPAKINLFLAATGRRADGYHELVSVVAPLDFGDELVAEELGKETGGRRKETGGRKRGPDSVRETRATFTLECNDPAVPVDGSNLVLKAAEAFREAQARAMRRNQAGAGAERGVGRSDEGATEPVPPGADALACPPGDTREHGGAVRFRLTKRIPLGAGLGGGSSNGVAALRALNALGPGRLGEAELEQLAAGLGSDCALFLRGGPVIMRGRGERVDALPESAALRLRGRRVLLFKPSFGIATAWAYRRLSECAADYVPAAETEAKLAAWVNGQRPVEDLLGNNLEPVVFRKYPALPLLLERLRREFGVAAGMSGSGSACFALLPADGGAGREGADEAVTQMTQRIRTCWGPAAWVQTARIV